MQDFAIIALETGIKILVILLVFSALAGFTTVIERKVLAYMQNRLGPMLIGPQGFGQIAADGIKMFTKEDILPSRALKPTFLAAPALGAAIVSDINVGVLFILGVMSAGMYAPLLAGMSSANKWSLLGAARAVIQMLSFEVVSGFALLSPLMIMGSLSLIDINAYQSGGITDWIIWKQPLACVLFLVAGYAETNRTPFDLLEHEAEVVSGYCTEYSGLKWGLFFIGEYANMFTISFVAAIIFFGGFNPLWIIPGGIAIVLKVAFFIFLFLWTRAAWPHVRPDQLMWLCWKVLMPLAVLNIVVTGFAILI